MDSPYRLPVGPVALVHAGSWSGLPGELAQEQSWEVPSSLPADTLVQGWARAVPTRTSLLIPAT